MSKDKPSNYETEAVIQELAQEDGKTTCRLKPVAATSAVEIGETKYLVGRKRSPSKPKTKNGAVLWTLNNSWATKTKFTLAADFEQWALTAWKDKCKVRLNVDGSNEITKITLL